MWSTCQYLGLKLKVTKTVVLSGVKLHVYLLTLTLYFPGIFHACVTRLHGFADFKEDSYTSLFVGTFWEKTFQPPSVFVSPFENYVFCLI